jgi:NAD(P)-dependent dehydrogenase (short-subunit alcohol dehydrogenase family)
MRPGAPSQPSTHEPTVKRPGELFDLSGRTAVVTGAARGIGRGLALHLAAAGADVAIVARPANPLAPGVVSELERLGARARLFPFDLADTSGLAELADDIWRELGAVHVLVNNAAISHLEHFNEITVERWQELMRVNVDAPFFLGQRFAEHMIRAGVHGRIINVSSKNGLVAEAGLAHYNTSKGALELLTQSLAVELGEHGIAVNTVAPGLIETDMAEGFDLDRDAFDAYYNEHIPLGHAPGTIEDCAGAVLLLASPAGRYITGQHIVIDGGVLANQLPRLQFMRPYVNPLRPHTSPRSDGTDR